jgi:hypothetical protein
VYFHFPGGKTQLAVAAAKSYAREQADLDAGAILATRNTADFEETGIELIDPWKLGPR